jgi:hypothetical protein
MWALLVDTIQSDEGLPLKIRCLEVLAKAAAAGSDETARQVLAALGVPNKDTAAAGSSSAGAR